MKRFWLCALLLLLLAVPAWGVDPKTTNWVGGGVDPTLFDAADNWSNGVPATTDTVQFLNGSVALPTANFPNAGEVFALVIDGNAAGAQWWQNITDFCGPGDWNYSSLQIGALGRNQDFIYFDKDSSVAGTVQVYGILEDDHVPTNVANATITVKNGGNLVCDTVSWTITQPITIEGALAIGGGITLLANGGVNLAGGLDISQGSPVLDTASPINCTGNCIIQWGSGNGDILGGLDANGFAVTQSDTAAGNSLTCDVAGTLDLGTTEANSIAVTVSAATTIGNSFACGSLSMGANVTCADAKTITVGTGGFTYTSGTLTGNLSVATTGNIVGTAGTLTGTLNLTAAGADKTISWAIGTSLEKMALTVSGNYTAAGDVYCASLAGSGSLAGNAKILRIYPLANNFWTATFAASEWGYVSLYCAASRTNATLVNMGTSPFRVYYAVTTVTLSGGLTCGSVDIGGSGGNAVLDMTGGNLTSAGAITFGAVNAAYRGTLTLGPGVHTCTNIGRGAGNTAETHVLNLRGRLRTTGTLTGAGITVTPTQEACIDCQGVGVVTNVTATGNRLVVRRAVDAAGMPLRSWNGGDTNVNVRFLGRKVIGEPGVN